MKTKLEAVAVWAPWKSTEDAERVLVSGVVYEDDTAKVLNVCSEDGRLLIFGYDQRKRFERALVEQSQAYRDQIVDAARSHLPRECKEPDLCKLGLEWAVRSLQARPGAGGAPMSAFDQYEEALQTLIRVTREVAEILEKETVERGIVGVNPLPEFMRITALEVEALHPVLKLRTVSALAVAREALAERPDASAEVEEVLNAMGANHG